MREITEAAGAAQRLGAQLPLRLARRAPRRDPRSATATRPTSRGVSGSPRSVGTRRHATSSTRSSCRTPRTSRRPPGATTCASSPSCRRGSARGASPPPAPGRTCARSSASSKQRPPERRAGGAARACRRDDHADDGGDGRTGPAHRVGRTARPSSTSRPSSRTSPTCSSACSRRRCGARWSAGERAPLTRTRDPPPVPLTVSMGATTLTVGFAAGGHRVDCAAMREGVGAHGVRAGARVATDSAGAVDGHRVLRVVRGGFRGLSDARQREGHGQVGTVVD